MTQKIARKTDELQTPLQVYESTEVERSHWRAEDDSHQTARNTATLIIIPTYNEIENLPRLVRDLLEMEPSLHILVIDDGSPDGTGDLADELAAHDERVRVIHREGKLGLGTAYVAGFRNALANGYERVVQMDADYSHRPEDLPKLLSALDSVDVAIGSRNVPGGEAVSWSPFRDFLSKGGSVYSRILLRLPVRDCTSGFKAFRRSALEALDLGALGSNGFGFQVEVNYGLKRAGMRFAEVPIVFPNRTHGESKMSMDIIAEAALLVLKLALGLVPPPINKNLQPAPVPVRAGRPVAVRGLKK